jgi:uncharacterized protein
MNPFYFGSVDRRLFGVYEPAAEGTAANRAAILCPPWGAEYINSHRTLRQLALKLSGIGYHTLRFDFYGTGDSGGDTSDADMAGWEADLKTAIDELTEITGVAKITLIGLRLGGTISAKMATRLRDNVAALVLWDPVMSGLIYLRELGLPSQSKMLEVKGFLLSEQLLRELGELDLNTFTSIDHPPTLLIVTEESPLQNQQAVRRAERPAGPPEVEFMKDVRPWLEDSINSGTVPVSVLQRITNWLDES